MDNSQISFFFFFKFKNTHLPDISQNTHFVEEYSRLHRCLQPTPHMLKNIMGCHQARPAQGELEALPRLMDAPAWADGSV